MKKFLLIAALAAVSYGEVCNINVTARPKYLSSYQGDWVVEMYNDVQGTTVVNAMGFVVPGTAFRDAKGRTVSYVCIGADKRGYLAGGLSGYYRVQGTYCFNLSRGSNLDDVYDMAGDGLSPFSVLSRMGVAQVTCRKDGY